VTSVIYRVTRSKFTAEVRDIMYACRRSVQLARACRTGYNVAARRQLNLGAARVASSWSPGKVTLLGHKITSSLQSLRAPNLFFRRGYAGEPTMGGCNARMLSINFLSIDLPPHKLVGLPALSPTMETGMVVMRDTFNPARPVEFIYESHN
jgi:hypothetical protein